MNIQNPVTHTQATAQATNGGSPLRRVHPYAQTPDCPLCSMSIRAYQARHDTSHHQRAAPTSHMNTSLPPGHPWGTRQATGPHECARTRLAPADRPKANRSSCLCPSTCPIQTARNPSTAAQDQTNRATAIKQRSTQQELPVPSPRQQCVALLGVVLSSSRT